MKDCVELLLHWYQDNKRSLPWRQDKDPYHVWISEIMLQQTRIEAVIDYYDRFMKRLPTIEDLSKISEDELLKLWEGLGYYSRARNLKKAAIQIMENYQGQMPRTYAEILLLPGIGDYTAGAISSICFNLREVAIDGNVMRVYTRVLDKDLDVSDLKVKKEIGNEIKKILPEESGDFNQGIMELGETICIPNGIPKCDSCPLKEICLAHKNQHELEIPRKIMKKEKKEEKYTVLLLKYKDQFAIRKRENGLLKNMWEFPNIEGHLTTNEIKERISFCEDILPGISYTHIFTHKKWIMNSYIISVKEKDTSYHWYSLSEIKEKHALPSAFMPFYDSLIEK